MKVRSRFALLALTLSAALGSPIVASTSQAFADGPADSGSPRLPNTTAVSKLAAKELLASISRARRAQKSFVAPFTQERTIGLLASKVTSKGTLTFVAPDKLRWDLDAPDDVSYWVLPGGISYRTKSGNGTLPKVSARLTNLMDDVRSLVAGDIERLEGRYDVSVTRSDRTKGDDANHDSVTITATSKPVADGGAPAGARGLSITLASDRVTPLRATLTEAGKDRTDIIFGTVRTDANVPPATMAPPSDAAKP